MKIALITGATAGIGQAIAHALAEKGFQLILTGRRADRLEQVSKEVEAKYQAKVISLCFDIRDKEQTKKAIESLPSSWKVIDVLVNNAGLAAGFSHIQDGSIDDWDLMIDTNIKGLLYITAAVSPLMVVRNKGHIVNIGSVAGKEVYENGNVYCATKHAVGALTKGMRMDMLKHNIRVTSVCPGMVETEFSIVRFKGDEERAKNVYKGMQPLFPEDIANVVSYVVTLPDHVCINDILVMPTAQASLSHVNRE